MGDRLEEKARELDRVKRAEARGETNPRRTSEDVRAEYEIERRQEKMRELRARIRELEQIVRVNREYASRTEAENARLREAGDVLADALKAPVTARIGARNHYLRVWDDAKRGTHG